ncbi:MAG: tetratricopeptide repeat protein [Chitinophagaceae bacterium]|nr:MAG: tetratricopeptide repeat protein [Chitinophagaceae bacterium]
MKLLLSVLLILAAAAAQAQSLANTEWIRIRAERKDGSRIVERSSSGDLNVKYLFTADSMFASVGNQYNKPQAYRIENRQVFVNNKPRYSIDSLSEMLLIVTELGGKNISDDLLNTYVLLNGDFQFDYAKQNGDLKIQGDTLISCNNRFSPIFKGDFASALLEWFPESAPNRSLVGAIVLNPNGSVHDVQFEQPEKFSKRELKELRDMLLRTSGNWAVPPLPRPYLLEVDFEFNFVSSGLSRHVSLVFNEGNPGFSRPLSTEAATASDKHFQEAVKAFEKNELEKAAAAFEKCIAIDSLNLTAHYNLAVTYYKLGRPDDACATWGKLRDLGQKKAEAFVAEYCKK